MRREQRDNKQGLEVEKRAAQSGKYCRSIVLGKESFGIFAPVTKVDEYNLLARLKRPNISVVKSRIIYPFA